MNNIKKVLKQHARTYIKLAEKRFNRLFNVPQIEIIDMGSYAAGTAIFIPWIVQIDEGVLKQNPEAVLKNTLPHEIAHLIDMKLNLYNYVTMKRIPYHGYGWKTIMKLFNCKPLTYYPN